MTLNIAVLRIRNAVWIAHCPSASHFHDLLQEVRIRLGVAVTENPEKEGTATVIGANSLPIGTVQLKTIDTSFRALEHLP